MVSGIIKQLLEAGVHFGHQAKKFNPKMKKFIFGKRSGIYIIDLEKTVQYLEEAQKYAKEMASRGCNFLFVATKRQLRDLIREFADSCGMYYINERWVGGLLTNFQTIKTRLKTLNRLLQEQEETDFKDYTKKERAKILKQLEKMKKYYMGVKEMEELPDVLYIVDPKTEELALREARKLSIPVIALIDTNGDPEVIDYPIPGNDDAMKSTKCITEFIVRSIKEGREIYRTKGAPQRDIKKMEKIDEENTADEAPVRASKSNNVESEVEDLKEE